MNRPHSVPGDGAHRGGVADIAAGYRSTFNRRIIAARPGRMGIGTTIAASRQA
jgi:hypothetical protein